MTTYKVTTESGKVYNYQNEEEAVKASCKLSKNESVTFEEVKETEKVELKGLENFEAEVFKSFYTKGFVSLKEFKESFPLKDYTWYNMKTGWVVLDGLEITRVSNKSERDYFVLGREPEGFWNLPYKSKLD